ncbi:hypothetical protein SAMD00019534_061620 [Acytostelium subglobosum LB1]|uniref:hypothetical protein n=1 Tax=Acytostelium subglobosum LB1 TaxID=1410327 RepID=UPI0006449484|nr:hypothetical protein SAMD00019534_061620 [Acytostelium subglobosum LB1]GAM22987.1 hypothetical protein SAMD00019534_061620 [Acytostelium subglobosum LB1]|eukprot:XP_012754214.1 hypothetical protein SAMD00019534_061620 [Acytostelium subglobosum LB1]
MQPVNKTLVSRFVYQSVVLILIIVPYLYILNFAIFPWMHTPSTLGKGLFHSVWGTLVTIMILVSYYQCLSTNPGEFRDTLSPAYYLVHPIADKDEEQQRNCNKCRQLKPDRAHHCSTCNKCVLRMDHHCMWLDNCIGLFNHKYFILFLFYASISIIYFFGLLIDRSIEVLSPSTPTIIGPNSINAAMNNMDEQQQLQQQSVMIQLDVATIVITGLLVIIMVLTEISLMALLSSQLILLCRNMTTIEDLKRTSFGHNVNVNGGSSHHSNSNSSSSHKKYDKGSILNNIATVFGPPSFTWLLPTPPPILKQSIAHQKKGDIFIV